jgi:hypothetical protein
LFKARTGPARGAATGGVNPMQREIKN